MWGESEGGVGRRRPADLPSGLIYGGGWGLNVMLPSKRNAHFEKKWCSRLDETLICMYGASGGFKKWCSRRGETLIFASCRYVGQSWGPSWAKIGQRWPKMAEHGPKLAPRCPKMLHNSPKMGSKTTQDGPTGAQDSPKMARRWPKMPQASPKMPQAAPR